MIAGSRPVRIGAGDFTLAYDLAAFAELERRTGISILGEGISEEHLRSTITFLEILRVGLMRHHPSLSPEMLKDLQPRDVPRLREAVIASLRDSAGEDDEGGAEGPPVAQGSHGVNSGP